MKRLIAKNYNEYALGYAIIQSIDNLIFKNKDYYINDILSGDKDDKIKTMNEIDLSMFVQQLDSIKENLISEVEKEMERKVSFEDILDCINNSSACNKDLKTMLKKFKSAILNKLYSNNEILSINDLLSIKDNVNDEYKFKGLVDFDNRDKCFSFIYPNNLLISNSNESHTQLLQRVYKDKGFDITDEKDIERLDEEELNEIDINRYAFGHIVKSIAVIDTVKDVSEKDVASALTQEGIEKVYMLNGKQLKRIA